MNEDRSRSYMSRILLMVFLSGTLLLLAVQLLCYDTKLPRLTIRMGSFILIAGLAATVGCLFYDYVNERISSAEILRVAGVFYLLFVASGVCRYWMTDDRTRMESLTQILILRKIPKYSEVYVSILIFIGAVWLFQKPLKKLLDRRLLAGLAGCLCIGVTFLPHEKLGYKIIGSLLGTTEFNSFATLAFMGYFFIGYYLAELKNDDSRRGLYLTAAGLAVSLGMGLVFRAQLVKKMAYPPVWWQVIIPAGFVFLIIWLVSRPAVRNVFADYHPRWYVPRLVSEIVILTFIKAYTNTAKIGVGEALIMTVSVWTLIFIVCLGIRRICDALRGRSEFLQCAVLYTIGFVLMAPAAFMAFIEEDRVMIWYLDGMSQYLPKAVWFSQSIRDFFSHLIHGSLSFRFYDFSFGMGDAVIPSLDPLYWLYALFAPENMEAGYHWVTIFKLFLMGLAALGMFRYFKKEKWASVLASYVYVFSGYAFYAVPRHPQFANPMILLPLLVIAVEEIIRKRKWYLGTILIGLSLLSNYYFFYINTIILVIYFLVRFLGMEENKRTLKNFFGYLVTFSWAWILGVGLGSMTIFTSIMNYAGSDRSSAGIVSTPSLFYYGSSWPTDLYTFFITASKWPGQWFRTGFLPIAYLCVVLLFLHKGRKTEKRLLAIALAFSVLPVAGYVFNAMKIVTNRWSYVIALLISMIVAEMLPTISKLTKKEIGILSLSVLPYLLIALSYEEYDMKIVLKEEILLIASLVVVILVTDLLCDFSQIKRQAMLAGLMLLSVWLGGYSLYSLNGSGRGEIEQYLPAGTAIERATNTNIRILGGQNQIEDDFYRVSEPFIDTSKLNASMILGSYGLSYYNSTLNSQILEYSRQMGNPMMKLTALEGFNNRTAMNALASVRYYAVQKDNADNIGLLPYGYSYLKNDDRNKDNLVVYQNDYSLPAGYTYDQWIAAEDLQRYSEIERQEIMMTHVVIDTPENLAQQYKNMTPSVTSIKKEPEEISYVKSSMEEGVLQMKPTGRMEVTFDGEPGCETYLIIRGKMLSTGTEEADIVHAFVDNDICEYQTILYPADNTYEPGLESYVFNLGYHEEPVTHCSLRVDLGMTMAVDAVEIWCQPMADYPAQIEALKKDSLENIRKTDDSISGTVEITEPEIMVFSIPYARGWHVYVDGVEKDLLNVNVMYCGVELEPGNHEVLIRYEPDAIKKGLIVTVISLMIFIICIRIGKRKTA